MRIHVHSGNGVLAYPLCEKNECTGDSSSPLRENSRIDATFVFLPHVFMHLESHVSKVCSSGVSIPAVSSWQLLENITLMEQNCTGGIPCI